MRSTINHTQKNQNTEEMEENYIGTLKLAGYAKFLTRRQKICFNYSLDGSGDRLETNRRLSKHSLPESLCRVQNITAGLIFTCNAKRIFEKLIQTQKRPFSN